MAAKKQLTPADFFTVPKSVAGRKLYLSLPDGTPTEHYLLVLGIEAPAAHAAIVESARPLRGIAADLDDDAKTALNEQANLQFRSGLVIGWSFAAAHSREAVTELLTNRPEFGPQIERFSNDRRLFFGKEAARS